MRLERVVGLVRNFTVWSCEMRQAWEMELRSLPYHVAAKGGLL
jgi:hypothetical protein